MTGHDRLDTDNANGETEDQLLLLSNENQQLQGEIQRLRDELEYQRIQPNVEDDFEVEGGLGESSSPLTTTSLDANANTVALDASHGSAQVADDHNTDGAPAPSSEDDKTSGTPHYRGPELVFDDENPHPRNSMSFMKWATENINDIEQVSDYKVKLSMCEKQLWDIVATKRPPPSTSNDEAGQVDINDTAPRRDTIEYLPNLMGNSAEGTPHSEDDNTIQIDNITDRSDPENNVIEAFLVGAEDDEEIFDATPIETALPWWKQRPLMCATSLLIIVVITAVAITSSNNSDIDLSPETQRICFTDRDELKSAVDEYIDTDCGHGVRSASCEVIAQKYGWPINFWCVGNVTDLSALFNLKQSFNEDIGAWDVSRVTNMSALFNFSTSFNRDLSSWDVSNVKSMHGMCKSGVFDCVFGVGCSIN
jgi:surface protein